MGSADRRAGLRRPILGPVASARGPALYVIKIGSASQAERRLYDELVEIRARGARLLVVAGGAEGIAEHYDRIGRSPRMVTLAGGGSARYCPPEEMAHIVAAYETVTLPGIRRQLEARGLSVHSTVAATGSLVTGVANRPLSTVADGRRRIVRDHRAGTVSSVAGARIGALLETFDVVCLSPPVADLDGGSPLNVDADVLAAELGNALDADHLRLVTNTAGILRDPSDPASTIRDLAAGEGAQYARGRMRQKVRAAEIALTGTADVAISGPATLAPATRFWRASAPASDLTLLSRAVEIPSGSGDEQELAGYLAAWCTERGLEASIDAAGNLVATRGCGPRRLLMLGHLDTVAHRWPVGWAGERLSGRGCVDAKASLVMFLEALAAIEPPAGTQLCVVGAVEEESTSAGALYLREQIAADAVIIGEPSGSSAITVGYYGLLKLAVRCELTVGHTAGREALTGADRMIAVLNRVRASIAACAPDALVATLGVHAVNAGDVHAAEAVVDVRVPPQVDPLQLVDVVLRATPEESVEVLRCTAAVRTSRADGLVRAFARAISATGAVPRFVAKKGSCDMNTLGARWPSVPWLAYGPGDSSLDHTPSEHLDATEFRLASRVLLDALDLWLTASGPALEPRTSTTRRLTNATS